MRRLDIGLFVVAVAVAAVLGRDYTFGQGNQADQLPHVLKQMDGGWLSRDYFVEATTLHQPRLYYARALAMLGRAIPLPALFLGLTLLFNALLSAVTYYTARRLMNGSDLAAMLGTIFVAGLDSFSLGSACYLHGNQLIPALVALPLALGGLMLAIEGRPLTCAALGLAASLAHPLVGLEVGGIGIGVSLCLALGRRNWGELARGAAGFAALGALGYFFWVRPMGHGTLDTKTFLDIYARYRAPHHLIPSGFWVRFYVAAAAFFAAMGFLWQDWRRAEAAPRQAWGVALATLSVVALCAGGWFFVEVVPTRMAASLQTFRLLFLPKWLGLILLGGAVARLWEKREDFERPFVGWLLTLGSGYFQPFAMLGGVLAGRIHAAMRGCATKWRHALLGVSLFPFLAGTLGGGDHKELLVMGGLLAFALWMGGVRGAALRRGLPLAGLLALGGILAADRAVDIPVVSSALYRIRPAVKLSDYRGPDMAVAQFCRTHTAKDALFIVPPGLNQFRLLADRAVVVSFQFFPYRDEDMLEWKSRMDAIYGKSAGFAEMPLMDKAYHGISSEHLRRLSETYEADYAVLYAGTETTLPTVYHDKHYQVVRLR